MICRNASVPSLKFISLYQFAMWYRDMMPHDKTSVSQKMTECSESVHVVTAAKKGDLPDELRGLPKAVSIGGNKFMILRKKPVVVDTKNFDEQTEKHIWQYSRLLLFHHWQNEQQFLGDARRSATVCDNLYNDLEHYITYVQKHCLKKLKRYAERLAP